MTKIYVNNRALRFALREITDQIARRTIPLILAGVSIILFFAAPFSTDLTLSLLPRLIYWMLIVFGAYFLGSFMVSFLSHLLAPARPFSYLLFSGANAIMIPAFVWLMNLLFFPNSSGGTSAGQLGINALIAAIITYLIARNWPQPQHDTPPTQLLARLPYEKRGTLISMQMQDHYVEITTSKGKHLLLMRFSDAIREAGDAGWQIHRSHWIAQDQIRSMGRKNGKLRLTTKQGDDLPISRKYQQQLDKSLLLAKRASNG